MARVNASIGGLSRKLVAVTAVTAFALSIGVVRFAFRYEVPTVASFLGSLTDQALLKDARFADPLP